MRRRLATLLFGFLALGVLGQMTDAPTFLSSLTEGGWPRPRDWNRLARETTFAFDLRAGAFPGSGHPDVVVHVPLDFDPMRRPGMVLYFHGWNGCVATALSDDDAPCSENGDVRRASSLATQLENARVNAMLVAIELRADQASGDPGQLAMPGDLHELLRELLSELAEPLGYELSVDGLDRVVVVAHSGGYQAAATALRQGHVSQIVELDLLDALYGADEVFSEWMKDVASNFDRRMRFVDLYTAGGGTLERSRSMAAAARGSAGGYTNRVYDDDTDTELSGEMLSRPVVFKRVPREHSELPRAYLRGLIEASGFARAEH